jgi:putative membrane protein insertion efficiency factor
MEKLEKIFIKIATLPILIYIKYVSPFIAPSCRHSPSCSLYALEAIKKKGFIEGLILAVKRLTRCRPGGTYGYDPVPEKKGKNHE